MMILVIVDLFRFQFLSLIYLIHIFFKNINAIMYHTIWAFVINYTYDYFVAVDTMSQ